MLTVDVLNNFNNNGVPPHNLKLKIGDICIVMRNLARKEGLTNNTRVQITKISKFCIRVQTLSAEPKVFLIPRIRFKFRLPFGQSFQLLRTQFPLRLAYCISINKSQGQEYDYSLLDLIQPPFAHGQAYVAFSRGNDANKIYILVNDQQIEDSCVVIDNYVYHELLENV
jgi:ATP-dependent DNA helicase PIF1